MLEQQLKGRPLGGLPTRRAERVGYAREAAALLARIAADHKTRWRLTC